MFDSDISHYLINRTVNNQEQIYIGIDNKTGKPMLAVPGINHAVIGAFYYELSEVEYEQAKQNIVSWYAKKKSHIAAAA